MTREDIIRMAREAGLIGTGGAANEMERLYREAILDALPRFAALVAAAEREACAKEIEAEICDEIEDEAYCILVALLARIRARGQA